MENNSEVVEDGVAEFEELSDTPLIKAILSNNNQLALQLIASDDVNRKGIEGRTPLMCAAENDNIEILDSLLRANCDVNACDINGQSALLKAAETSNEIIAQRLIAKGADVNVSDKTGLTPMLCAAVSANEELVTLLLEKGANPAHVDKNGRTALHAVAEGKNAYAVDDESFDKIINDEDNTKRGTITSMLLEACEDFIDKRDKDGQTALFYAVREEWEKSVEVLLKAGANVNIKGNNKRTPLFLAFTNSDTYVISLLIVNGANVDERDDNQETPLFDVIRYGQKNVIEELIDKGATLNVRNIYGRTPVFYAFERMHPSETADLLKKNGARLNDADCCGCSVLSICIEHLCAKKNMSEDDIKVLALFERDGQTNHIVYSIINILYAKLFDICIHSTANTNMFLINGIRLAREFAINDRQKEKAQELHNLVDTEPLGDKLFIIFDLLSQLGADPNSVDSKGNTALHYAAFLPFYGHSEEFTMTIITKLVKDGARFDVRNYDYHTPLLYGLSAWDNVAMHMPRLYNDHYFRNKLYWQNFKAMKTVWEYLLKGHSLVNEMSRNRESVFHVVIKLFRTALTTQKESLQNMVELLKLFCQPAILHRDTVNRRDNRFNSPLHLWASLSLQKNENYASSISGELTFEGLLKDIFDHLRVCGVQLDDRDRDNRTALHCCRTWSAVKCLVDAGAKRNDLDAEKRPPLLAAACNNAFKEKEGCFFPDVTIKPSKFFRNCVDMDLDLWADDNEGRSILTLLLSSCSFRLAEGLVEVACDRRPLILENFLLTLCADPLSNTYWKSSLVGNILKCPKRPAEMNLVDALGHCCRNIMSLHVHGQLECKRKDSTDEPPLKKLKADPSSKSDDDLLSSSVHLEILHQLRIYADANICIDLSKDFPPLRKIFSQKIDLNQAPLTIPWTSYSTKHKGHLERVARRQNVESISTYWYNKEPIGSGAFGHVFAGINENDGREIAVKKIVKLKMQETREIINLTALADCAQIINYICFDNSDEDFAYIVLELMEGHLDDYFSSHSFKSDQNISLSRDLLMGVKYLHEYKPIPILHRDLHPRKILYKDHPELCLKIAGFGLSGPLITSVQGTNYGNRCWIAPEVVCSPNYTHTKQSDIYSCGLLLHYILSPQQHPFSPTDCSNKRIAVINLKRQVNMMSNAMNNLCTKLSPEATHLVKSLLSQNPEYRPSAADSLYHPLFWSNEKKMDFLCKFSEQRRERDVTADIEIKFNIIVEPGKGWDDPTTYPIIPKIKKRLQHYREYNNLSILDLIAFIRNARTEVHLNSRLRKQVLDKYVFLAYFPHLVIEVYKTVLDHGWEYKSAIKNVMSRKEH